MSCPRFVSMSLVCVLLSSVVHAQAPSQPPPDAPRTEPLATPPLITAPAEPVPEPLSVTPERAPARAPLHLIPRTALELTVGSLGVLGGAFASLFLSIPVRGSALCVLANDNDCEPGPRQRGFFVMLLTITLTDALSVYSVGNAADAQGRFLPTLGGAAIGTTVGLLLFRPSSQVESVPGMVAAALLPAIFATLGYELSHTFLGSGATSAEPQRPPLGLHVMPVVGRTPGGGLLGGLAGHF